MEGNLDPVENTFDQIKQLWALHCSADWPSDLGSKEGELMMVDTVISGCVTYFLESDTGLDLQRVDILNTCLEDLSGLSEDLGEESMDYFSRLHDLGNLLLPASSGPGS